jgi:hypothetical protein
MIGMAALGVLGVAGILWSRVQPSTQGEWGVDHAQLPSAEFANDGQVTVRNVRNFHYRTETDFDAVYDDRTYDLDKLNSVWYIVTPFGSGQGAAHTFLSFGFSDSTFVSVSVEARREPAEPYSLIGGMLKRYELIYVIGDERDLIGLRTQHRDNEVYVYPIRTDVEKMRALFVSVLERTNQLREKPEFYNTLTNNCTTSILRHVNEVATERNRYGRAILLPARSDRLAFDRGLIDTALPFDEAKRHFNVTQRAKAAGSAPDFSALIRASP